MSLLLYLLLILIFTVVNTIIIVRINSETQKKILGIKKEKKELLNEYHTLQKEIENLKKNIQSLKTKIIEEKSFTQLKEKPLQQKKQEKTDPVDILKQKNIINDEHIKKAKDFIKKSNSNFELLEVLLLLGYIDQNQYQSAKNKIN
jgi:ABC-type transport system involved in multi-copper enzyme maturation permease subunit